MAGIRTSGEREVAIADHSFGDLRFEHDILQKAGARLVSPNCSFDFLITPSGGPVIDEEPLGQALTDGRSAGAGLDVMVKEAPNPAAPLLTLDNVTVPLCCLLFRKGTPKLKRKGNGRSGSSTGGEIPTVWRQSRSPAQPWAEGFTLFEDPFSAYGFVFSRFRKGVGG